MRKEAYFIREPRLKLHIEYDYLTAGELGNILIRFQAATRSVAGFRRAKYRGLEGRPLLVASSIQTKTSIDAEIIVGIVGLIMLAPAAVAQWDQIAKACFRRLKIAIHALFERQHPRASEFEIPADLEVKVTRGNIDFHATKEFLDTASEEEISRLVDFLYALFGSARRVILSDDDSEITISKRGSGDPAH